MEFEVHAQVTEIYIVEAESFDEALAIASEMSDPTYTQTHGFEYAKNCETGKDIFY